MITFIVNCGLLFVMSIYSGFIFPLLFDNPSYIGFFLISILICFFYTKNKSQIKIDARIFHRLVILYFLFVGINLCNKSGEYSFISTLQGPIIFLVFIILLLGMNLKDFQTAIKYYIFFVVLMALCGLIAWISINWNFVNSQDWLWNISEATNNKATRDASEIAGYTFPYKLGLVLTGSYEYNFLNFIFYRASGWFHEPTTATAFIAPALIILFRESYYSRIVRVIFLIIIALFWLSCAAIGSLAAFSLIFFICMILSKKVTNKLISLIFAGSIILIYSQIEVFIFSDKGGVSLLGQKLESDDKLNLINLINSNNFSDLAILFLLIMLATFIGYYSIKLIGGWRKDAETYILILLYFFLHSLKGSWGAIFSDLFVFTFFFLFLRVLISGWSFKVVT